MSKRSSTLVGASNLVSTTQIKLPQTMSQRIRYDPPSGTVSHRIRYDVLPRALSSAEPVTVSQYVWSRRRTRIMKIWLMGRNVGGRGRDDAGGWES